MVSLIAHSIHEFGFGMVKRSNLAYYYAMRKWIAYALSLIALISMPLTFFLTVFSSKLAAGYFFLIFTATSGLHYIPTIILGCAPLLIPIFGTLYPEKKLSKIPTIIVIAFAIIWIAISSILPLANIGVISFQDASPYGYYASHVAYSLIVAYVAHAIFTALKNKKAGHKIPKRAIIVLSTVAATALVIGGTIFAIDTHYRNRYNAVNNELNQISANSITPLGGHSWDNPQYEDSDRGNGIAGLQYCATNSCPYVHRSWLVPLEDGKEYEFIKNLTKQNGFNDAIDKNLLTCDFGIVGETGNTCIAQGTSGTLYMTLELTALENLQEMYGDPGSTVKIPQLKDMSPKKWRILNISLTRTWGN